MIPELGQILLALALAMALIQGVLPLIGAQRGIASWVALAKPAANLQTVLLAGAFALLTYSYLTHDFSVANVVNNSNTNLPTQYLISAVWGNHEGSLLLWALILGFWGSAVTAFSRSVPNVVTARVLAVLGLISVGFLLFMILTSNPFERMVPAAVEGRDLNPLLQDPGLIIHPPMLYMGYVGFAVPFAFAIAAMLGGRLDAAWARWSRPWTNVAWLFLTLGIALGSWWAYYELGWGGWWFWDPVENASFMPWLVGTALMHSLAVTEKRGAFKAWTVLLAIFAFSLSLLGTFLVRSGVLTSVHAFASDPDRGVFILAFLVAVVGSSLLLYAVRANDIKSSVRFETLSRETGLLMNNVILLVSAVAILIGTLYPLVSDALQLGKISVGRPYFDSIFMLLMFPLLALVGVGPMTRWKKDDSSRLINRLRMAAATAVVMAAVWIVLFTPNFNITAWISLSLGLWVAFSTFTALRERLHPHYNWRHVPRGFWGMILGHIGLAVFVVGTTLVSTYSIEKDIRLTPGESYTMGEYTFTFNGVDTIKGPNYTAYRGDVDAIQNGVVINNMHPEKRTYLVQKMPMTEAAIDAGFTRDLFVALGEDLGKDAWSFRIYHKPFIRWIWLGTIIMSIGGLLAATDRRYRVLARRNEQTDSSAQTAS